MTDYLAETQASIESRGAKWFKLRRVIGAGPAVANVDVDCNGVINNVGNQEIIAGAKADDLDIIFTPYHINLKQWPGGTIPLQPPFDVDQRIPRENGADKVIVYGKTFNISLVKQFWAGGELCRLEMRVTG